MFIIEEVYELYLNLFLNNYIKLEKKGTDPKNNEQQRQTVCSA